MLSFPDVRRCLTCEGKFEASRRVCPEDGDVLIAEGMVTADTGRVLEERYRLGLLIGAGGMGQVYEAEAIASGETVAVKLLKPGLIDRNAEARFRREAEAMAILRHPGVVRILEFRRVRDGTTYMVMERLLGPTFSELRRAGKFASVDRAVDLMREACLVLSEAHAKGIVHRDLKPSNLVLHRIDRTRSMVKVLDFGIVKFLDWSGEGLTSTGEMVGTIQYMAPEQSAGRAVTPAADVYGLGVVLFEALAGRLPFIGRTAAEFIWLSSSAPVPAPSSFRPDVPPALDEVVSRALAKRPENRYRDAGELARALEEVRGAPVDDGTAPSTRTLRVNPSLMVGSILDERYELHEWVSPARYHSHIYRATHLRTGAEVAVRIWKTGKSAVRDALVEAFRNEARAMGVRHQNLIAILDLGFTDECVYIVTEFVESVSLRALIAKRAPLARPLAARLVRGAAEALAVLHAKGIVSGGLSPETVRVTGSMEHPDAMLLTPLGLTNMRQMEALLGSAGDSGAEQLRDYMAPEQRAGSTPDGRSDVWSLAAVLIELLGGRVHAPVGRGAEGWPAEGPGEGPGGGEGVAVSSAGRESRLPSLPYGLPLVWGEFLDRAVSDDPEERIGSMAEFLAAMPAD